MKNPEKAAAKQQKYRQMKKEKIKTVAKKMIPTFALAIFLALLYFSFLFFNYPFPLLRLSETEIGRCENVYYEDVLGTSGVYCFIELESGNKYHVQPAPVSRWGGFEADEFEEATNKNQSFVITYITNDKYKGTDCITSISDTEGNIYLENWDVLRHGIFFWCIAWILFIIFVGLYIWYKWNTIYQKTKPGHI